MKNQDKLVFDESLNNLWTLTRVVLRAVRIVALDKLSIEKVAFGRIEVIAKIEFVFVYALKLFLVEFNFGCALLKDRKEFCFSGISFQPKFFFRTNM